MLKEKCIGSYEEAVEAQKLGANRVELCENLAEGGTTPSYGTIKMVLRDIAISVFVMIRPRGGDFCYTKEEIEIMKEDIKICKQLGVKGVVFGVLTEDKKIDYEILEELVECAKPMSITFHKAIDEVENPVAEVKKLADIGVNRILSSGTKATALEGKDILNDMIKAGEDRIIIVVAGQVTKDNFEKVSQNIPSSEYHGKKIV